MKHEEYDGDSTWTVFGLMLDGEKAQSLAFSPISLKKMIWSCDLFLFCNGGTCEPDWRALPLESS